ncbi:MAG: DUF3859 domain-containing protein [Pseudomonadota bacterium]
MCYRLGAIGVGLALLGGPALARIDLVATGFYCSPDPSRVAIPLDDTIGGRMWRLDMATLPPQRGTIVPSALGVSFGVFFETTGSPGSLDVRLTHPPLGDEDQTLQTWRLEDVFAGTMKGAAYTLDTEGELATGDWTFDIRKGTRTVLSQTFTLVDGDDAEDLLSTCEMEDRE